MLRRAVRQRRHSRAVLVHPIKPTLKAPETKRLKLKYVTLHSTFAFKFNLRRYNTDFVLDLVRRCRLNR